MGEFSGALVGCASLLTRVKLAQQIQVAMPVQQKVPFTERIKNFKNPCGKGCSICCGLYSLWGMLMLIAVGIMLQNDYRGIDGDIPDIPVSDHDHVAKSCYIASAIHGGFMLLSIARLVQLYFVGRRSKYEIHMDD